MKLKHPFNLIISGPTGSGKSTFCIRLLQNLKSLCTEQKYNGGIFWCFGERTEVPDRELSELNNTIRVHKGIPEKIGNKNGKACLIILDDLLDVAYSKEVCNLFTKVRSQQVHTTACLLNQRKNTRYVSIGFYPARNYQPLVAFGGSKIKPVLPTEQYVATMADCLPRICNSMCGNEQYGRSDGPDRLNTTGSYKIARLHMDKYFVALKFQELHYLINMFHILQNQLNLYITALPDLLTYVISDTYVEPAANASNLNLYPRLFEELNTIL